METATWIVQILLALLFLLVGLFKLTQPYEKVAERMTWAKYAQPNIVKSIGGLEILGAIGVILPAVTRILPWLTPLAAVGLGCTMIGATITHLRLKEYPQIVGNIVLFALAVFVAYSRFVVFPIQA